MNSSKPFENVVVGVIFNENGEVLFAQRPEGKSWNGWWEFPGGKIEGQETINEALHRELKEEVGIDTQEIYPWVSFTFDYPEKIVKLHFCRVLRFLGTPKGLENQEIKWVSPTQAKSLENVLPGSIKPVDWLVRLPNQYAISHIGEPSNIEAYFSSLQKQLGKGIKLFQLREPNWPDGVGSKSLKAVFEQMMALCHEHGAKVLVNSAHPKAWWNLADGVQIRAQDAIQMDERPLPEDKLVAVSTHHLADLLYAQILSADFAVLGHVLDTSSHPQEPALGWEAFNQLREQAGIPVYAIGGQSPETLKTAYQYGAHGIAAIKGLQFD